MGPTTFREQLRTIFGVRLTRAELGGLVSAFDLHQDGMVDAKEFAFRCGEDDFVLFFFKMPSSLLLEH